MADARLCPACGKNELPPRCRKCDECIARKTPTDLHVSRRRSPTGLARDVVLECGHVVASKAIVGENHRCPLHRRLQQIVDVHDGVEEFEILDLPAREVTP